MTHTASVHTTGMYTMLTGTLHQTPKVDQTRVQPDDHPHLGSVVATSRARGHGVPPFVCLPTLFRAPPVDGIWPGQTAGFLGRRRDPFVIEGDRRSARFEQAEVDLPDELTSSGCTAGGRSRPSSAMIRPRGPPRSAAWSELNEQAWSLVDSPAFRRALDLDREPSPLRDRYGRHLFGQGLLLARRLIEADVPFVTVYWIDPTPPGPGGGEFDSHGHIYKHMRERLLPPADLRPLGPARGPLGPRASRGHARRRHERVRSVAPAEQGRRSRPLARGAVDPAGRSRDHPAGRSTGRPTGYAAYPASDPVTPPDLGQTILHLLGVPDDLVLHDPQGRPIRASLGRVDEKLIG